MEAIALPERNAEFWDRFDEVTEPSGRPWTMDALVDGPDVDRFRLISVECGQFAWLVEHDQVGAAIERMRVRTVHSLPAEPANLHASIMADPQATWRQIGKHLDGMISLAPRKTIPVKEQHWIAARNRIVEPVKEFYERGARVATIAHHYQIERITDVGRLGRLAEMAQADLDRFETENSHLCKGVLALLGAACGFYSKSMLVGALGVAAGVLLGSVADNLLKDGQVSTALQKLTLIKLFKDEIVDLNRKETTVGFAHEINRTIASGYGELIAEPDANSVHNIRQRIRSRTRSTLKRAWQDIAGSNAGEPPAWWYGDRPSASAMAARDDRPGSDIDRDLYESVRRQDTDLLGRTLERIVGAFAATQATSRASHVRDEESFMDEWAGPA